MKHRHLFLIAILIFLALLIASCVNSQPPDSPQPESEQPTSTEQTEPVAPSQETHTSNADPEETVLVFLEKLGYDRSYLLADFKEEKFENDRTIWAIGLKDGFDELCFASLPGSADRLLFIKFVVPPGDISPDPVRPGPDIVDRAATALGLFDQGYILPSWPQNPGFTHFRKYASFENYEICTNYVLFLTDTGNDSLLAIHFSDTTLPRDVSINFDRESAINIASSELADNTSDVLYAELVNHSDFLYPPDQLGIWWEIALTNGSTVSVNADNGTVSDIEPMY